MSNPKPTLEERAAALLGELIDVELLEGDYESKLAAILAFAQSVAAEADEKWRTVAQRCDDFDDWAVCCNDHDHAPDCQVVRLLCLNPAPTEEQS